MWRAVLAGLVLLLASVEGTACAQTAPVTASFAAYTHGLRVLDVQASFDLSPGAYRLRVAYRTAGLLGALVHSHMDATAQGRFADDEAWPSGFSAWGETRGRPRRTLIEYKAGVPVPRILRPADIGRVPVSAAQARGTVDDLSAIAELLNRVRRTGRCDGSARIYDGRTLSLLQSRTDGTDSLPRTFVSPYAGPALRCDFTGHVIAGYKRGETAARRARVHRGTAWFATPVAGGPVLPVRITFRNPVIGTTTMYYTGFGDAPSG